MYDREKFELALDLFCIVADIISGAIKKEDLDRISKEAEK